jgi:MFS family permease
MPSRSDAAVRALPFIIACGCLIAVISFGPRSAVGLFLAPMTEARGWSREAISLAVAIQNLLWGAGQPFAGMLADRYGTARVIAGGAVLYALALVGTAVVGSAFLLQLTLGVAMGLALAAASFSIVLAAFGRLVTPEKRTIAFGIGTAAGSLGQFLFAPLSLGLIEALGWENALLALAALVLAIIPLSAALRGRGTGAVAGEQSIGDALQEAFGYRSYVLLTIGFFVCGFHVAFITTHLPPYIADHGLDPKWGAWSIAFIGLFNIVGSLAAGALGQRWAKQKSLAFIYLARSVAILAFITIPISPASVLVFAAAMGLLWLSTVPLTSGLIAGMFGARYMATLFGFVFFSHQIGAFLGVWLGGWAYDTLGSYDLFWWVAIALGVAAAIIHWPIREIPVARLRPA